MYTNEYLFNCFGNSFSTLFVKILKSAHFGPQIFFHSKNDLIYARKLFQLITIICTDNLKILQDSKINLIGQKIREIFCKSIYVVKNFALRPHFWIKFLTFSHCASLQMPTYVIDVLWCQPIKLIQVVSTSEFHEYWWKDIDFIFLSPPFTAGPQK